MKQVYTPQLLSRLFSLLLVFLITKVVHLVMVTHVSNIFQEVSLSILSGYASLPNYVLLKSNVA